MIEFILEIDVFSEFTLIKALIKMKMLSVKSADDGRSFAESSL